MTTSSLYFKRYTHHLSFFLSFLWILQLHNCLTPQCYRYVRYYLVLYMIVFTGIKFTPSLLSYFCSHIFYTTVCGIHVLYICFFS